MSIRLLKYRDKEVLQEYLTPHTAHCMFICRNLQIAGVEYQEAEFQGEYFGYFKGEPYAERILGVIVHYWSGYILVHANEQKVLEQLVWYLKQNITRPVAGVFVAAAQAEFVTRALQLSPTAFSIDRHEGLYKMNLLDLGEMHMPDAFSVVDAKDISRDLLMQWMNIYEVEALGAPENDDLPARVQNKVERILRNDCWVLIRDSIPVSLVGFNCKVDDIAQIGPVWTPTEHRNRGFARLLLSYTLHQAKLKGIKQATLFAWNTVAIKVYLTVGFRKIGDYRLILLAKPISVEPDVILT